MFDTWNKPLVGLAVGALLGFFDGLSALLYPDPEVRSMIGVILMGSTFKGLAAGLAAGFFARKFRSMPLGILVGLALGALVTYPVAAAPTPNGTLYFWEIMLPGSLVGALVGFATQRFGKQAATA